MVSLLIGSESEGTLGADHVIHKLGAVERCDIPGFCLGIPHISWVLGEHLIELNPTPADRHGIDGLVAADSVGDVAMADLGEVDALMAEGVLEVLEAAAVGCAGDDALTTDPPCISQGVAFGVIHRHLHEVLDGGLKLLVLVVELIGHCG